MVNTRPEGHTESSSIWKVLKMTTSSHKVPNASAGAASGLAKHWLIGAALLAACAAQSAQAADVSVTIQQPGVYGRLNFGDAIPRDAWVYQQPILIAPAPDNTQRQPIYMYVPPGHSKNWSRHCSRYNACGQSVVFVQDRWVRDRYDQHRGGRDRDGDGVRNSRDRDRDGDGTRNSRDRQPNNPNRQ